MIIAIDDEWRIETDPHNYVLQNKFTVKEGKRAGEEEWRPAGYYASPLGALLGLVKRSVLTAQQTVTLREFAVFYKKIAEQYKSVFDKNMADEALSKLETISPIVKPEKIEPVEVKPPVDVLPKRVPMSAKQAAALMAKNRKPMRTPSRR